MHVVIDVGNSRIKLGLLREAPDCGLSEIVYSLAIQHSDAIPWRELESEFDQRQIDHCVIAGGNPTAIANFADQWPFAKIPLHHFNRSASLPLTVEVDEPDKVGIDRLLNAIAVNSMRPSDQSAIIVDSGTATTIDFVSKAGAFEGGAILPGFELAAKSLNHYTALLPLIAIDELTANDASGIGKNTRDALRQGLHWGIVGSVKELITRQSSDTASKVIVTGGGAALLLPHLENALHVPLLSLHGLLRAFTHQS